NLCTGTSPVKVVGTLRDQRLHSPRSVDPAHFLIAVKQRFHGIRQVPAEQNKVWLTISIINRSRYDQITGPDIHLGLFSTHFPLVCSPGVPTGLLLYQIQHAHWKKPICASVQQTIRAEHSGRAPSIWLLSSFLRLLHVWPYHSASATRDWTRPENDGLRALAEYETVRLDRRVWLQRILSSLG
ncbi:unnamed protein product, partial [Protopolystoma xenopodis]